MKNFGANHAWQKRVLIKFSCLAHLKESINKRTNKVLNIHYSKIHDSLKQLDYVNPFNFFINCSLYTRNNAITKWICLQLQDVVTNPQYIQYLISKKIIFGRFQIFYTHHYYLTKGKNGKRTTGATALPMEYTFKFLHIYLVKFTRNDQTTNVLFLL